MIGSFFNPLLPGGTASSINVDYTGLPATANIGDVITLTASTNRDISTFFIERKTGAPVSGLVYAPWAGQFNDNNEIYFDIPGTYSITLLQATGSSAGYETKDIQIIDKNEGFYIVGDNRRLIEGEPEIYSSSVSWRKYVNDNMVWGRAAGNGNAIAVDSSANFYLSGGNGALKYDSSGSLLWFSNHGGVVNAIAVDGSGNVYIGGNRTSNLTTRKYDSSGNLLWSVDHGANVNAIAVDGSGNVYTGGVRTSNLTTRKYDSSGNLLWSVDHGANVNAIAVDGSGNVYTGGNRTGAITTRKYDTSGTLQWSRDHGAVVNAIAVDGSGNVYTGGQRTSNLTTRKYNTSGTLQWSSDHGANVNAIAVDGSGNVYTGSQRNSSTGVALIKYDSSGNITKSYVNVIGVQQAVNSSINGIAVIG
jgi:hypothetical protein